MKRLFIAALVLSIAALTADVTFAQAKQRVRFAKGSSAAGLSGAVRGYAYRDYVVKAGAGQTISVELSSPNTPSVFTIFRPNGDGLDGAVQTENFTGELPASGDYVIRVGMMRAHARRRGSVSNFRLTISVD